MSDDPTLGGPALRQIDSWRAAEQNAVVWMQHWGYADAHLTSAGADGGVDVRAREALAQVKFEAMQVGTPALQRLLGAAMRDDSKQLMFFCGGGYSKPAVSYANRVDMALFTYDLVGRMRPVNQAARAVMNRPEIAARRRQEQLDLELREKERVLREIARALRKREQALREGERARKKAERALKKVERAQIREKEQAAREVKEALRRAEDERRREEHEAAIQRGENPDDGTKELVVVGRVVAGIVAVIWGWKAILPLDPVALGWSAAFALSAIVMPKVRIWPLVWIVWTGFLSYHFATMGPSGTRGLLGGLFAILTVLLMIGWAAGDSAAEEKRSKLAAARERLERKETLPQDRGFGSQLGTPEDQPALPDERTEEAS